MTMDKAYLIKLTSAVYRATELFPKQDPLINCIKTKGLEILSNSVLIFVENNFLSKKEKQRLTEQIINDITAIKMFFELAENQGWLASVGLAIFNKEYDNLLETAKIEREKAFSLPRPVNKKMFSESENQNKEKERDDLKKKTLKKPRHRKIIQILEKKDSAQIRDFKAVLPEVSKRTLRRDMDYLLNLGFVERKGDKNNTLYKIKSN